MVDFDWFPRDWMREKQGKEEF